MRSEWQTVRLRELVTEITSGVTPQSGSPRYYGEDGEPFAKIDDLTASQGKYVGDTFLHVKPAALRETGLKLYPAGTLLLSMYGTIGLVKLASQPLTANQALAALMPPFKCDTDFLYHLIDWLRPSWERFKAQTTQANINGAIVKNLELSVPEIEEQRRIAEILDALDDQIRMSERIIAKLELQGAGLVRHLLSPGVDSEQVGSESESPSHGLRRNSQVWPLVPYAEMCTDITVGIVVRPTRYYRTSGIPILRSANVRDSGIMLKDIKYMSATDHTRMKKTAVRPGDLVTVRTGYPGTTAVVPSWLPEANCVDIIISRPGREALSEYLAIWINSEFGKGQVLRGQGGLAQQHFNIAEMKSLMIAKPPIAEQRKIIDAWKAFQSRVESEERMVDGLRALKRGLTNDLLAGRVRVPREYLP